MFYRDGVTKIEFSEHYYGDHSIGEFHVYKGDTIELTITHRAVAEIYYFQSERELEKL